MPCLKRFCHVVSESLSYLLIAGFGLRKRPNFWKRLRGSYPKTASLSEQPFDSREFSRTSNPCSSAGRRRARGGYPKKQSALQTNDRRIMDRRRREAAGRSNREPICKTADDPG